MAVQSLVNAARMAAAWLIAMGPIVLVIAAVVGLVALVIANWETVKKWTIRIWEAVWNWLKGAWGGIVGTVRTAIGFLKGFLFGFHPLGIIIANWGKITGWIREQWDAVKRTVRNAVDKIGGFFKGMWNGITSGLKSALNGAIGLINGAISGINALISGANKVPGISIPFIPYIPYLAEGGITTGPTMAMIGEGTEREAVLPLSKLQGLIDMGRSGGQTVVFEIRGGSRAFREFFQESVRADAGGDVVVYAGG
jgi:phage-related protein